MSKRSKENVSAIVSGAGLLTSVWTDLNRAVREKGGTDEDLYRLTTPDGRPIISGMANLIVGERKAGEQIYPVTINYGLTHAQMIEAGHYNWHNNDITEEHFPIVGFGEEDYNLVLVHLGKEATTREWLLEIKRRGLWLAKIEHLLAFGVRYPEKQREFPIAELGSGWVNSLGDRRVAYLGEDDGQRELGLDYGNLEFRWPAKYRVLAVSK